MSSVTPDIFYVLNLILSFSICSQSFNKICMWEVLGANAFKGSNPGLGAQWVIHLIGHFCNANNVKLKKQKLPFFDFHTEDF